MKGVEGLRSYAVGFVLSLVLTGLAFVIVSEQLFNSVGLIWTLTTLAVAQVLVQLFFFLHVGREAKPRWKLVVMLGMLIVLAILVLGSLWIMQSLNYHMTDHDMTQTMIEDEEIKTQ